MCCTFNKDHTDLFFVSTQVQTEEFLEFFSFKCLAGLVQTGVCLYLCLFQCIWTVSAHGLQSAVVEVREVELTARIQFPLSFVTQSN